MFGAFSALLPAKSKPGVASPYEGFLLHTDAGPREVRLFGVRPQGAGYALDKVVLLTTDDNWFRPSDVCVAPDGSILVADWYDPGVGGHGMGDTSRGRIYRLTTKSPVVLGDSARRSEPLPSWIQRFTSPNLATRQMELQRGRESGRDVSAELKNLGSNRLLSLDQLKREFDAAHAREWLISYRSTEINLMIEPFWALAKHFDGQDRTYLSALNIALGSDPVRRAAILEDLEKHFQNWDDRTAWLVWELQPPKVVAKLGERLAREQMNVLQTELALGALAASSNNEGGESLLKLIRASDTDQNLRAVAVKTFLLHIHGKWKHLKGSDQVRETIESLQKVPELLPFALEMITSCDRKEFQEALEQLANGQNGVGLSLRYAAIDGLSKFRNDTSVDVLVKLL
ncbi:MAG TPA: hypothetical protein PKD72_00945, partial [Gemmatales bacterium]|nr:hypothetical protein [Gemmatales bacterium]